MCNVDVKSWEKLEAGKVDWLPDYKTTTTYSPVDKWVYVPAYETASPIYIYSPQIIAQGWQCPVCKRVYAPHVDECKGCGDE